LQSCVVLRDPDVSEEHIASILTIEEGAIQELEEAGSKSSDIFLRNVGLSKVSSCKEPGQQGARILMYLNVQFLAYPSPPSGAKVKNTWSYTTPLNTPYWRDG
jgi:hypothetical protein